MTVTAVSSQPCLCPTCGQAAPDFDLMIDIERGAISRAGVIVYLQAQQMQALQALFRARPGILSSADLEAAIGQTYKPRTASGLPSKVLHVVICRLRKQLQPLGLGISSRRRVGYTIGFLDTLVTLQAAGAESETGSASARQLDVQVAA